MTPLVDAMLEFRQRVYAFRESRERRRRRRPNFQTRSLLSARVRKFALNVPRDLVSSRPMSDAERWDEKYRSGRWNHDAACDPFVARALDELGAGDGRRALDLACGPGRHALDLVRRGWQVEAWDVSAEGLALLAKEAADAGAPIATRVVDLTADVPADAAPFDLIVLVNYLQRSLMPLLPELLAPGGRLLYATFTTENTGDHPSARHCLEPGELAEGVRGLEAERHEEQGGRAGLLARKACGET